MASKFIREDQWAKIYAFLKQHPRPYAGSESDYRRFIEGVLWMTTRSGAQWRLLPEQHGAWNTIYKRFARWCDYGIWQDLYHHTKIHVNVDALGNPLRFVLTGGQRHDFSQAEALLMDFIFERVIADWAYDADSFLD